MSIWFVQVIAGDDEVDGVSNATIGGGDADDAARHLPFFQAFEVEGAGMDWVCAVDHGDRLLVLSEGEETAGAVPHASALRPGAISYYTIVS